MKGTGIFYMGVRNPIPMIIGSRKVFVYQGYGLGHGAPIVVP